MDRADIPYDSVNGLRPKVSLVVIDMTLFISLRLITILIGKNSGLVFLSLYLLAIVQLY